MHEVKPRSLGGEMSMENSIAVCGSGTTGCHGFAQRHEMIVTGWAKERWDGYRRRIWEATTDAARKWLEAEP